jgi:iron-sulfur cluster assembly protein
METSLAPAPTTEAAPVQFTETALAALRNVRATGNIPAEHRLRVGVTGGGCSGMSYVLDFDAPTSADEHFTLGGVDMVMDQRHALYVHGMVIDFNDGLNARGFVFQNPNAKTTCGCGTSFSA